jgi:hypothetical protein
VACRPACQLVGSFVDWKEGGNETCAVIFHHGPPHKLNVIYL